MKYICISLLAFSLVSCGSNEASSVSSSEQTTVTQTVTDEKRMNEIEGELDKVDKEIGILMDETQKIEAELDDLLNENSN